MKSFPTLLVMLGLVFALCGAPAATQIQVPADFATIQAAIDAATAFDTVVVAPGTYVENLHIEGKSTRLASHYLLDGDPEHIRTTIIDGSNPAHPDSASVIRLVNAGDALVMGFTITGGKGTRWQDQADGHDYREGGGILTEGGQPRIYSNLIIANSASSKSGVTSAGGGGIRSGYGSVDIRNNVIAYNTGRYGGGLVLFFNGGVLKNNIFYRNSGGEDFGGGAIWATSASVIHTIENNTILENRSVLDGGGILLWSNVATMVDNIVWGNVAGSSPQISLRSGATSSTVSYSDVEGGFAGTGNLALLPDFSSSSLYLDPTSPCVDSGNPLIGKNDLADPNDGTLARFPSRGSRRNDMGAFGGPGTREVPSFNAPGLAMQASAADFGTVSVADSTMAWFRCTKEEFGFARIDSVVVGGDPLGALTVQSPLPVVMGPSPTDSLDSLRVVWHPNTYGTLTDTLFLYHTDVTVVNPMAVLLSGLVPGATGDANFDGVINSSDIIYLVNFVFKGGATPKPVERSGDANCDGNVTTGDIIFLVNFVFKSGPSPCP